MTKKGKSVKKKKVWGHFLQKQQ